MASVRQVEANRQNGLKGGVKTDVGKAISRLNARKDSIFVSALTPEDSEDLYAIEDELIASMRPVGRVEEMLVEKLALTWLRMQRCARAEAEFHIQTWQEPHKIWDENAWEQLQKKHGYGMRAVPFKEKVFERMVKLIDLYDTRLTNQFLKLLHEVERLQRLRKEDDGAVEPENQEPSSASLDPRENAATPQSASADQSHASAATQTSCPPSESLFLPCVAQAPSPVMTPASHSAQPGAAVPHTPEKSQVVDAKEAAAPMAI